MIVYGTKTVTGASSRVVGTLCPSCKKEELRVFTEYSYFFLYWIPVFPYRRRLVAQCSSCQTLIEGQQLVELRMNTGASSVQFPGLSAPRIQHFAGVFLILLFIGVDLWRSDQEKNLTKLMAAEPRAGDIVIAELDKPYVKGSKTYNYTAYVIRAISGEKISYTYSDYMFPTKSSADKFLDDLPTDAFGYQQMEMTKEMLLRLSDNKKIARIKRPDNYHQNGTGR